jgi:hypothetical protein
MKLFVFRALMLAPLAVVVVAPLYLLFFTNVPQLLYIQSIRNIPFDCMRLVDADYVYVMKPGPCRLDNIEFKTAQTHDPDGFRNVQPEAKPDVAVIGDSHAYGWGVGDEQTFPYLLSNRYGYKTRNLAIPSYATARELDVLKVHGDGARYVVLQYCDNDAAENEASLVLSSIGMHAMIATEWTHLVASYHDGKAQGLRKPLTDLAVMVKDGNFATRVPWRRSVPGRNMDAEASAFARLIARYRPQLEERRLIVFESVNFGLNTPQFAVAFGRALRELSWLNFRILDSSALLERGDYYFLDDHLRPSGHAKLAAALAHKIAGWETASPSLRPR